MLLLRGYGLEFRVRCKIWPLQDFGCREVGNQRSGLRQNGTWGPPQFTRHMPEMGPPLLTHAHTLHDRLQANARKGVRVPLKQIEYGVYGDLNIIYPKAIFYLLKRDYVVEVLWIELRMLCSLGNFISCAWPF